MKRRMTAVVSVCDWGQLGKTNMIQLYLDDDYEKGMTPYHTVNYVDDVNKYIKDFLPNVTVIYR